MKKCQYQNDCRVYQAHTNLCWMNLSSKTRKTLKSCPIAEEYTRLEQILSDAERTHLIPSEEITIKIQRGWRAG